MSKPQSALPPAASPCAPTCRSELSDSSYCCLTRQRVSYLSISLPARFFFQQGHPSILSRSTLVALDSDFFSVHCVVIKTSFRLGFPDSGNCLLPESDDCRISRFRCQSGNQKGQS